MATGILRALTIMGILVITVMAVNTRQKGQVSEVIIDIAEHQDHVQLMDEAYLRKLLADEYGGPLEGLPLSYIDINELETLLNSDAFVQNVQTYVDAELNLHIEVMPRTPVARLDDGKVRCYVDANGTAMPMSSSYSARVPIIHLPPNGLEFLTPARRGDLMQFLAAVRNDDFMNRLVDQVVIDGLSQMYIIPHIGDERIKFGKVDNMEDKFENIKIFYKKKMSQGHFGKCKWIDARFAGQIICDLNKLENS